MSERRFTCPVCDEPLPKETPAFTPDADERLRRAMENLQGFWAALDSQAVERDDDLLRRFADSLDAHLRALRAALEQIEKEES